MGFGKLVRDQQGHHHQQARIAHLAHRGDQFLDPAVDIVAELGEVRFLAVIAGNLVGATVNRDIDLRHLSDPEWF